MRDHGRAILSTTEEASHSWGETFGDQKRHRLVCGKLLENDILRVLINQLVRSQWTSLSAVLLSRKSPPVVTLWFFFRGYRAPLATLPGSATETEVTGRMMVKVPQNVEKGDLILPFSSSDYFRSFSFKKNLSQNVFLFFFFLQWTDVNECQSSPCQNGGRCIDGVGNYSCDCKNGFDGKNCENGKRLDHDINRKHMHTLAQTHMHTHTHTHFFFRENDSDPQMRRVSSGVVFFHSFRVVLSTA